MMSKGLASCVDEFFDRPRTAVDVGVGVKV